MLAGHVMVGGVLSTTTIVAEHEFVPPRLSVTVSVTELVPNAEGPDGVSTRLTMLPSGSYEPLSTWAALTLAWQPVPAGTVMLWQTATGGMLAASQTSVAVPVNDKLLTEPAAWIVSVPVKLLV